MILKVVGDCCRFNVVILQARGTEREFPQLMQSPLAPPRRVVHPIVSAFLLA
jgi:hypothetical protein